MFLKGESDLVLSYTTSPAYHILEEKKDNYAAANFSEGHYLQVEVQYLTTQSDLTGHCHIGTNRVTGQARNQRGAHSNTGTRTIFRRRTFRYVDVDVAFMNLLALN